MSHYHLVQLAIIIVAGVLAQLMAWRFRLPSILLLIIFGFVAGPVTHLVKPDAVFGDLLFPLVSLSVAVILYEGGLSLRIGELKKVGGIVRNILSIGVMVTWILSTIAAYYLLHLNFSLAILFGAILVVTGPTVILPLLRQIRPVEKVNTILKWEGMVNDPLGAILTVLVFESILSRGVGEVTTIALTGILKTVVLGGAIGILGAYVFMMLIHYRLIPDFLQNPVSLMMVFAIFSSSNLIQAESGLFAVTITGIFLANQKKVAVRHIIEFKENLRVLLISVLFIVLAARISLEDLRAINTGSFLFLAALLFFIRPAAVYLSTIGSHLNFREKSFLCWMAPRGIVAAAVSSLFALELVKAGYPDAGKLVPLTFFVIIGTITIYGLTAIPLAKFLKIANPNPQGVLILGAQPFARALGKIIRENGFKILMVDTDWYNIKEARLEGCPTHYGSILSESILEIIDLTGIGRLLALTPNKEVNSLAAIYFSKIFGTDSVFQLSLEEEQEEKKGKSVSQELRGNILFSTKVTYSFLMKHFEDGASIKATSLSKEFDYSSLLNQYGKENVIPLLIIENKKKLEINTPAFEKKPKPGQILVSLILTPGKEKLERERKNS